MPLSYPDNTIWYVRASLDAMVVSEGSAVAIRLQKRDDVQTAKTYLLTCAHVVRGATVIHAWPPDVGYNGEQAKDVEVDATIRRLSASDPSNAADDWVILQIRDAQAAMAAPTVRKWADEALSGNFRIWGYVGGDDSFPQGKVLPTRTPEVFPFRDASNGVVYFNGQGTRFGISGGGVFGEDLQFAGIHRGRFDSVLQVNAVSSYYMGRRLYELGYEVVRPPLEATLRSVETNVAELQTPKRLPYQSNDYFCDERYSTGLPFVDPLGPSNYVPVLFNRVSNEDATTAIDALSDKIGAPAVFIAPFPADVRETLLAIFANAAEGELDHPASPYWCNGLAIVDHLAKPNPPSTLDILAIGLAREPFNQQSVADTVALLRRANNAILLLDLSEVPIEALLQDSGALSALKSFLRKVVTLPLWSSTARLVVGVPKHFGVADLGSEFFEQLVPGSVYQATMPSRLFFKDGITTDLEAQDDKRVAPAIRSLRQLLSAFKNFNSNSLREAIVNYLTIKPTDVLDRLATEDILATANHFLGLGYLEFAFRLELFCQTRAVADSVVTRGATFTQKRSLGLAEVGPGHISDVKLLPVVNARIFLFGRSSFGKTISLRQIEAAYSLPSADKITQQHNSWIPIYVDCAEPESSDLRRCFGSHCCLVSPGQARTPERLRAHERLREIASYESLEHLFSSPILFLLDNVHRLTNEPSYNALIDALLRHRFILTYSDGSEYRAPVSQFFARLARGSWGVELDGIEFAAARRLYQDSGGKGDIETIARQIDQPVRSMLGVPYLVSSLAFVERIVRQPSPWITRFEALHARVERLAELDSSEEVRLLLDVVLPEAAYARRVERKRVELLPEDGQRAGALGLVQDAAPLEFSQHLIEEYFLAKEIRRRCKDGCTKYPWTEIFRTGTEHWPKYYTNLVQVFCGALNTRTVSALVEFLAENDNPILAHTGLLELEPYQYEKIPKAKEIATHLVDRIAAYQLDSNARLSEGDEIFDIARALSYYDPRISYHDPSTSAGSTALLSVCSISDGCSIGRFPVTNLEFSRFVHDGGYTTEGFWTKAGWAWKERTRTIQPALWMVAEYSQANAPVVAVSFHEAKAYCAWLSAKLAASNLLVDLPTVREWETAANVSAYIAPLVQSAVRFLDAVAREDEYFPDTSPLLVPSADTKTNGSRRSGTEGFGNQNAMRPPPPIGMSQPTATGLYDVFDCVWQWCNEDWGGGTLDSHLASLNPSERRTAIVKGGRSLDLSGLLGGGLDLTSRVHNAGFRVSVKPRTITT